MVARPGGHATGGAEAPPLVALQPPEGSFDRAGAVSAKDGEKQDDEHRPCVPGTRRPSNPGTYW